MISRILIPLAALLCLFPSISSATALFMGLALALIFGNSYLEPIRKITPRLLTWSIVCLGANMNLIAVGRAGIQGLTLTAVSITATLGLGLILGKLMKVPGKTSILISVGTAICGGSAIAAVSPVVKAKPQEMSVALGVVFLLNSCALFLFPWVGHHFQLSQYQFGLWSALAIHDTSSVVGATLQYGQEALEVGTTVKLARALWIVPLAFGLGFFWKEPMTENGNRTNPKKPWFILGFILCAAFFTWLPTLQTLGQIIDTIGKRGLVLTLFFIGSSLSRDSLRAVGLRPFFQGVCLWLIVASSSFLFFKSAF